MKIYIVIDSIYGDEGNPGARAFVTLAQAQAEESRLIAENDDAGGLYLVSIIETDLEAEAIPKSDFEDMARAVQWLTWAIDTKVIKTHPTGVCGPDAAKAVAVLDKYGSKQPIPGNFRHDYMAGA